MSRLVTDFPRAAFTEYMLSTLGAVVLIGDAEPPDAGGWDNDPNLPDSSYQAYVVLTPSTVQSGTGSVGSSTTEWRVPYTLSSYGISRAQAEWNADQARKAAVALARSVVTLDTMEWKIQQCRVDSIGGIVRNDSTEPSEFSEVDLITMWMSKEM